MHTRAPDGPRQSAGHEGATTVADAIVDELRRVGVRRIYGLPGGGSNMLLIDAALRQGIDFVLAHHETGAMFMAAGEAEVTGIPGACISTVGPGLANAINGLAHCYLDRVPCLLLSDRPDDSAYLHQLIDQHGLTAPVVKHSELVRTQDARAIVRLALADAVAPPAGPVHLDLPTSVARAETGLCDNFAIPSIVDADRSELEQMAALLRRSSRPVLLAGLGARHSSCVAALRSFARRFDIPVLTTYKAKGVVPETDPLAAGLVTNGAAEDRLLTRSDALLAIGFDTAELMPGPWRWSRPTVMVGHEPQPNTHVQATIVIAADPAPTLAALAGLLNDWQPSWGDAIPSAWVNDKALRESANGVAPAAVVTAAREVAPPDAIATIDAGSHMLAASLFWKVDEPGCFLISNSLATMGYALPAAIGASLAQPGRQIICFTGDGGLAMAAGELATAARVSANVVVIVFNDATLNLIKIKQERQRQTTAGLDFGAVDWASVAAGFGVPGLRVTTSSELNTALRDALDSNGPTLIDVMIDPSSYARLLGAVRR